MITSTVNISTSTSFVLPPMSVSSSDAGGTVEPSPSVITSATALYNSSLITSTYLSTSLNMPELNFTITHASSVQNSLVTLPKSNATHSATYSAITDPSSQLYSDESSAGTHLHFTNYICRQ